MKLGVNQIAVLSLVRAGLWEKEIKLLQLGNIDFYEVYRLAEEQSVVGLVAAGIEHIVDIKVPQDVILNFVGHAVQLEHRNNAMNSYISVLVEDLRKADVYTVLIKGQGVAQCYERPLWRACGDIDLLLNNTYYSSAKAFLDSITGIPASTTIKNQERRHLEYYIDSWLVELHGTLHTNLSRRVDQMIDEVQDDVFIKGNVRSWDNGGTTIFLPGVDNDIIFVFTHILQHFFEGGIGLRQLCDLSRLLSTYKDCIDYELLKARLSAAGLMTEWKAFGCLLVDSLGLNPECMPFYDKTYQKKAAKILSYVIETGNFGQNKDNSYIKKHSPIVRKIITLYRQTKDSFGLMMIFPIDAARFLTCFIINGMRAAINGD